MSEAVETLFDEFALAYVRGERPDVGEYLARAAAGEQDDLADLVDRFLQAVPARAASEEEVVLLAARLEAEPPLLVLRRRRALSREAVVDALVRALGLDPAKREKVGAYYHELEVGLLDPAPVDRGVWEALGELLKANAARLAVFSPPAAPALYRRDADFALAERMAPAPAAAAEEPDEVDRLFRGPEA